MEALQKANTSLEEVKENQNQEDDNDVDGNDD